MSEQGGTPPDGPGEDPGFDPGFGEDDGLFVPAPMDEAEAAAAEAQAEPTPKLEVRIAYDPGTVQPSTIERLDAIEARLDEDTKRPARRVMFVCNHCGTSEEREMPDRPSAWAEVLQGVREEIRTCALLDTPQPHQQPPPYDRGCERAVCAAAVVGLRVKHFERLQRSHFQSTFFGWTWHLARETTGRPNLEKLANQFELRGIGRAEIVLSELYVLAGPYVAARCDEQAVERILSLAWQRDMLYDALAIAGWLRQDLGVDREDIKERMRTLRDKLKAGPT